MNFSSPMVGLSDWQAAYESQPAQQNPVTKTIRVYNYWDLVPSMPDLLPPLPQYTHVGTGFKTSFYADSVFWYLYQIAAHSVLNLQVVLQNALSLDPQVWIGQFLDQSFTFNGEMLSTALPSGADVPWIGKMRELEPFKQTILQGSQALKARAGAGA